MPRRVIRRAGAALVRGTEAIHRNAVAAYLALVVALVVCFFLLQEDLRRSQRVVHSNRSLLASVCDSTAAIANLDRFFLALARVPPPHEKPRSRRIRLAFIRVVTHDLATVRATEQACAEVAGRGPPPRGDVA